MTMNNMPGQNMDATSPSRNRPVKLSVRQKIIGISVGLIAVLIGITVFSSLKLVQIKHEIVDIAEFNIPAANLISLARQHSLEQELHLQRIFKNFSFEKVDLKKVDYEIHKFEYYDQKVDAELIHLEELLQTGIRLAEIDSDKLFYKKVFTKVKEVDLEHQEFVDHALEIILHLKKEEKDEANLLRNRLDHEIDEFNLHISEILENLEKKTQSSINLAKQHEEEVLLLSLISTAAALVLGLSYALIMSTGFVRPIQKLSSEVSRISSGKLDVEVNATSWDEIGQLSDAFQYMVDELKEKQQIEETFGKYVDPRIVKVIADADGAAKTDGERRQMSVMFAGVAGLQDLINDIDSAALADFYNEYLEILGEPISDNNGILDKFIGTVAMGFWGPPFTEPSEHPNLALAAAGQVTSALPQIQSLLSRSLGRAVDGDAYPITVGIASGDVVVGNMGSTSSMSYTVMGDVVNNASRLKGASRQYGVPILCSEATKTLADPDHLFREIDQIVAVGMDEPMVIYELVTDAREQAGYDDEVIGLYAAGLDMYRAGNWPKAREYWQELLLKVPGDRATQTMLSRIPRLEKTDLDSWSGIWRLDDK